MTTEYVAAKELFDDFLDVVGEEEELLENDCIQNIGYLSSSSL